MFASDLRVLVNAAANGAGRVIAHSFLREGAKVLAFDVDRSGLENLKQEVPAVEIFAGDAASETDVASAYALMDDLFSGLDVLVNNVGIAGPTAAVEEISLADWKQTLDVNLNGHFLFARAAASRMKRQASGLIVNISSGSARVGLPLRLPYVVSKGAVLSLTKNLARELGPFGIRVNAILPGAIRGERIERVITAKAEALGMPAEDYARSLMRYISLRTMVEPEDIAAMILFLASPGGERISGQLIGVDGNVEWEE